MGKSFFLFWARSEGRQPQQGEAVELRQLEFETVTPQDLIDQYHVSTLARVAGDANRPPESATESSTVEKNVCGHIQQAEAEALRSYNEAYQSHRQHLNNLDEALVASDVSVKGASAKANLQRRRRDAIVGVTDLFNKMCRGYTALQAFRETHRRGPDANLDNRESTTKLAVLLSILGVEMVINSIYISQKLAGGLFEGLSIAGTIALVNLCLGFFIGFIGLPYLMHVDPGKKVAASIGILLAVGGLLCVNLGVAHMRTLLGEGLATLARDAAVGAFRRLMAQPFDLGDVSSFVLFCLGIICSAGAVWSGFRWDEPYPEYADQTRTYNETHEELLVGKSQWSRHLAVTFESSVRELEETRDAIRRNVSEYRSTVKKMHDLQTRYRQYIQGLEETLNAVLGHYRQTNISSNRTAPKPCYFDNKENLAPARLEDISATTKAEPELKAIEADACARFDAGLKDLHDEHQAAQDALADCTPVDIQPQEDCGKGRHRSAPQADGARYAEEG